MNRTEYEQYAIVNPAGQVKRWRIPRFFGPEDVQRHLPHSLLFYRLRAGYSIIRNGELVRATSAWEPIVLWDDKAGGWLDTGSTDWPKDDRHALLLYRVAHASAPARREGGVA